jgi:hypothetical protein
MPTGGLTTTYVGPACWYHTPEWNQKRPLRKFTATFPGGSTAIE